MESQTNFLPDYQLLLQYLRQKPKLEVAAAVPNVRGLLMSLRNEAIDGIKQQFQLNDNRIDLQKFLWLVNNALDQQTPLTPPLYYQFVRLFQEIDIDNSRTIEWKEFLEYLSQSVSTTPKAQELVGKQDRQVLFHGFRENVRYRKDHIAKVVEVQRNHLLAIVNHDHSLEFVCYQNQQGRPAFQLSHVDCRRVLSLDYAEQERLFGVLLANRTVLFVEEGEIQKNMGALRPSGNEVDIQYLPGHRLWAVTCHDCSLQLFPSPRTSLLPPKTIFQPHPQPITGIAEIDSPHALVTASLDGSIRLWQPLSARLIIELLASEQLGLSRGEQKGVKGVATFSQGGLSYVVSWMFTSQVLVWQPSLSLSKPYVGELKGHLGLVIDCAFTWKGEVVSLDDRRNIRVWNPERLQCIQTLTAEEEILQLLVLRGRPYLAAYGRVVDFYRIRTDSKADLRSEMGLARKEGRNVLVRGEVPMVRCVAVLFSSYCCAIAVVTSVEMRILNVNDCRVLGVAGVPGEDEEFIMASSKGERRLWLATSKANILEYSFEDGALVRSMSVRTPDSELKFIHFHQETAILLAVLEQKASCLVCTYHYPAEEPQLIKEVQFEQSDLLLFAYSQQQQKFFMLSSAILTAWNYCKLTICNKIDLVPLAIPHFHNLIVEEQSGSLLLTHARGLLILRISQCDDLWEMLQLHYQPGNLLSAALLQAEVPTSFLSHQQTKSVKCVGTSTVLASSFKSKSKVGEGSQGVPPARQRALVLSIANSCGQVSLFNLSAQLQPLLFDRPVFKGNLHLVKENRKTFLNQFTQLVGEELIGLTDYSLLEDNIFVHRAAESGTVNGRFYVFNDQQTLHLFDVLGNLEAEWNVNLTTPRHWTAFHNELDSVLARLDLMQHALRRICPMSGSSFRSALLSSKFMTDKDRQSLRRFEGTDPKSKGSTLASKCSLRILEEGPSGEPNMNTLVTLQGRSELSQANLFLRKLGQTHQVKKFTSKSSVFYEKLKANVKSRALSQLAVRVQPPDEREKGPPIVLRLEEIYPTEPAQEVTLASSAVKQTRKEGGSRVERPRTSIQVRSRSASNLAKLRVSQVGTGELAKNFAQYKIDYHNFVSRNAQIIAASSSALKKQARLRL